MRQCRWPFPRDQRQHAASTCYSSRWSLRDAFQLRHRNFRVGALTLRSPSWPGQGPSALACAVRVADSGTAFRRGVHRSLQGAPAPLREPPSDPRELLLAITASQDLRSLLQLLHATERRLNVRHLDAALSRLSRLGTDSNSTCGDHRDGGRGRNAPPPQASSPSPPLCAAQLAARAATSLAAAVLPRVEAELAPRDCASMLASLARLAPQPPAPVPPPQPPAVLLAGRLLGQLRSASLRDRVALLHAAARLRLALPGRAVVELLTSLDGELGSAGKPQDVSMTLWALATMGLAPPPGWLRRLLAALPAPRLAAFGAQALANSAWALAKMGFRPRTEWLAALVAASGQLLKACSTQELVNLLWALAVLRHRPAPAWLVAALELLHERAPGMCAQDVSNVCWALAVLHVRPGLPLLQRLVARALAVRRSMEPRGVVTTLWGLARLRVVLPERAVALLLLGGLGARALLGTSRAEPTDAPLSGAAVEQGAAALGGRAARDHKPRARAGTSVSSVAAGPGDLAGAALVLGRCRHVPPRRWLLRYYAAVSGQLDRFGPRELSTLLYGLALLRLRPDSHWLDRLLAEVERHAAVVLAAAAEAEAPQPPHPPLAQERKHTAAAASRHAMSPPQPVVPAAGASDAQLTLQAHAVASPAELPPQQQQPQQQPQQRREHHQSAQDVVSGLAESAFLHASLERRIAPRGLGPEQLGPPQVAVVLWAVAELGHAPTEAWLLAMVRAVAAQLQEFESPEAAVTVRALQQLAVAAAARRAAPAHGRSRRHGSSSPAASAAAASAGGAAGSCREVVGRLVARLAGSLPDRSLYGTLRAASLALGPSYASLADQQLMDVYSVRSLGLLRVGGGGGGEGGGRGTGGY